MVLAMLLALGVIAWGIYIARSQSIRLSGYPYPVPLSQPTANRVATLFIVFGAMLFLICGWAMLSGRA